MRGWSLTAASAVVLTAVAGFAGAVVVPAIVVRLVFFALLTAFLATIVISISRHA